MVADYRAPRLWITAPPTIPSSTGRKLPGTFGPRLPILQVSKEAR